MGPMLQTARLDLVLLEPADARALAAGINRNGHRWAAGYPLGSTLLRAELTLAAAAQERPLGAFGSYQVVRRADDQRDRRRRLHGAAGRDRRGHARLRDHRGRARPGLRDRGAVGAARLGARRSRA